MKLDKEGYLQLKEDIERLERNLRKTQEIKGIEADGNNPWHDNFGYEQIAYQTEPALIFEIKHKKETLAKAEVIKPHGKQGVVDIGDIVTLYDEAFDDEFKIKLNASYNMTEADEDIEPTSVNSPMGEALWGAKINSEIKYRVDNREFSMKVVNIERIPTNLPLQ